MPDASWWTPWQGEEHFRYWPGAIPLLISLPHDGCEIPPEMAAGMCPAARLSPDTDWRVAELYDFARELRAHILRPRWSRYVVDLNRPPDGAALYPGRAETGLCPTLMFSGEPIYAEGEEPTSLAIAARVERYWRPYHRQLKSVLENLQLAHGQVLLWEGHSIRSECPMFFAGRLPDYNLGSADGRSCSAAVQRALSSVLQDAGVAHAINGRFKGGFITRSFGQPHLGIQAVQMEMTQSSYLDERNPEVFRPALAAGAQALLRELLQAGVAALSARIC
jgi:N-formylglutamate deformylase